MTQPTSTKTGARKVVCRAWLGAALALAVMASPSGAHAQGMQKVLDLNHRAMEAYTNLQIDKAERILQQALRTAKQQGVTGTALARTYVNLGVVAVGGRQNKQQGVEYFSKGLKADPDIKLDPLTSTPTIKEAFTQAKQQQGGGRSGTGTGGAPPPPPGGGTGTGAGGGTAGGTGGTFGQGAQQQAGDIPHEPVREQLHQTPVPVFVKVPDEAPVDKMVLHYKGRGMQGYEKMDMKRMQGGFGVQIPCGSVFAPSMQYYVVAYDSSGGRLGTAGTRQQPIEVPIVSSRSQPAPALPGKAPPQQCSPGGGECPPGIPNCGAGGGGAGPGETCTTNADCGNGLKCKDNFCVSKDGEEGEGSGMPRFFFRLGFAPGVGLAGKGKEADSEPPSGIRNMSQMEQQQYRGYVSPSNEDQICDPGAGDGTCNVNVTKSGLLPALALRATFGYYIIERLAIAGTFRYQFNAGQGPMANIMIGLRGQVLITEPSKTGFYASAHLGTSYGQIQLQPPQSNAKEPYIISGLNGVQLGGTVGYRFMRNVGVYFTPEMHFQFPQFLFAIDPTLGVEVSF